MKFDISAITTDNLTTALIGYVIVFTALVMLYFIFDNLPRVLNFFRRLAASKEKLKVNPPVSSKKNMPGAVNAAIAMSLHMYFNELHDDEATNLTISKVSRNYSPWNSKIYGVTHAPQRNLSKSTSLKRP